MGKRIIMVLMFSLFGNNEIDDTRTASKDLASLGLFLTVLGHQFHYSINLTSPHLGSNFRSSAGYDPSPSPSILHDSLDFRGVL